MVDTPSIPLRRVGAELIFRSTISAFSKAFWDVSIVGDDVLPPGPCFIYGNHSNNYDPFILNLFTELGHSTAGVMTMEHIERGLVGWLFRSAGIVGTRKHVPEPHLIKQIYRMLEDGRRVVVFPEGGRRWDGRPAPWIEATAKLFQRSGVPVHPVLIHGSYVSWPRWAVYPRPARLRVEPLPAVRLDDCTSVEEAVLRLSEPISGDENMVGDEIRPSWAYRPADGIHRLLYRHPETGEFNALSTADGRTVRDDHGRPLYRVLPDSVLVDRAEQRRHAADVHAQIRTLELTPDRDDILIQHDAVVHSERVNVSLHSDRLCVGPTIIPFDDIQHIGLERSDRLWVTWRGGHVYCRFPYAYSVLAWYDTLLRLAPHINS